MEGTIEPGVYQMSWRGLRLSECWRFSKGWILPIALLMKLSGKRGNHVWLPASQSEPPCPRDDLSAEALAHLDPEIEKLAGLGYSVISYKKVVRSLDPHVRDTGGFMALHHDGQRTLHVLYLHRAQEPPLPPELRTVNPFGVIVPEGGVAVVVVNHNNYFDEPALSRTIQLPGVGIEEIAARLERELGRARKPIRVFVSPEEAIRFADVRGSAAHARQIGRGLYVKVPPEEARRILYDAGLNPL
ncbi:MAG: hypothetical protein HY321_09845 [Armatimonadetes bacterium]|nr:hypothetical protein [Armatimonadota bacterium]